MKAQKALPRMGRPVKVPETMETGMVRPLHFFVDEVVKILWKCGAHTGTDNKVKGRWSSSERWVELDAQGRPWKWAELDRNGNPRKAGCALIKTKPVRIPVDPPLRWGRGEALIILKYLFFAPMMLAALPSDPADALIAPLLFARLFAQAPNVMIKALPKIQQLLAKKMQRPAFVLAYNYAIDHHESFWSIPAKELQGDYGRIFGISSSIKDIEHARELVRKKSEEFPQKSA